MGTVAISVKVPGGAWADITNACVFSRCTFTSQFNGVPGSFDIFVRDPAQALSFTTGSEIKLVVDGVTMFGGYITTVGMTSFAPAADTSNLATYDLRAWHLTGPDYNIVLDKRVIRNTADYLESFRISSNQDGVVLAAMIDTYADMDDFSTAGIDTVATIPGVSYVTLQQGWTLRKEFETLLPFSGAVYYVNGDKVVQYKAYDDVVKRWGFSDNPNHAPITASPAEFQNATYGFSSVEATEDANAMANDVFVWGGSEWAGTGGTVFHRSSDATSIADHNRWQHAEVHFGEEMYKSTAGVTAVADAILDGPPGTDAKGQEKGLKNPQWSFTFQWNSDQVPLLSGTPDHILAGDLVTIYLSVFGVTKLLPVRSLSISFPDAFVDPATDDRLIHFEGTFGLQLSDSFTLWRYLSQSENKVIVQTQAVVNDSSPSTVYGASYSGIPTPVPNGATVAFYVKFGYIDGTLMVYQNGLLLRTGTDFLETDPVHGMFTMVVAPLATDRLDVTMFTLAE